jgi:hypothetical protein
MKPQPNSGDDRSQRALNVGEVAGAPPAGSARTLDCLVQAGRVERRKVPLGPTEGFRPVYQYVSSVPIAIHMSWSEWITRPRVRRRCKSVPPQRSIDGLPLFATQTS